MRNQSRNALKLATAVFGALLIALPVVRAHLDRTLEGTS